MTPLRVSAETAPHTIDDGFMVTIAFSMIGYNESHNLPRAMESVRWADEVIYVDCGSADGSSEVARRYTERVFARPNNSNLNVNKAYGIEQAGSDWVFYLDPDEAVSPALAGEIRDLIAGDPPENAFQLPRRNYYLGAWLKYGGQYPDLQLRLFRRGKARFPCKHVHEKLEVDGEIGVLTNPMDHYTNPLPVDVFRKLDFYSTFNAELLAASGLSPTAGMALGYLFWTPATRFLRRYLLKGGFRDGWPGLTVAMVDALEIQIRFLKFSYLARHPEAISQNSAIPVSNDAGDPA